MAHIGKEKIDDKTFGKLFENIIAALDSASKRDSRKILNGLLTETEKVMLTKRFTAVMMFNAGYSTYAVEQTVKISSSTALRIRADYQEGVYDELVGVLNANSRRKKEFWETAETLLRLGMPSQGKDRWKHVL